MKVIARVWHQAFDMKEMKSVVKFHEKAIDIKLKDGYSEALMKVAIEGEKSYSEEFKKFASLENHKDCEAIIEAIGKNVCSGSCRITLEFQALPNFVYVFRNSIGKVDGQKYRSQVFVSKDSLKPIL